MQIHSDGTDSDPFQGQRSRASPKHFSKPSLTPEICKPHTMGVLIVVVYCSRLPTLWFLRLKIFLRISYSNSIVTRGLVPYPSTSSARRTYARNPLLQAGHTTPQQPKAKTPQSPAKPHTLNRCRGSAAVPPGPEQLQNLGAMRNRPPTRFTRNLVKEPIAVLGFDYTVHSQGVVEAPRY